MKTTQNKAISAYKALPEILALRLGLRDSLNLLSLKKALELSFEFETQEEAKLIREFNLIQEGEEFVSSLPKDSPEYIEEMAAVTQRVIELKSMVIEIDHDPVTLHLKSSDMDNLYVSTGALVALEDFVLFKEIEEE